MITYGTNPGMGIKITDNIPVDSVSFKKSLEYMNFTAGDSLINQLLTMYLLVVAPTPGLRILE